MSEYDTAQICKNGHVVTSNADEYPEDREMYCSKCGSETIMNCPSCNASIRGSETEFSYSGDYEVPAYCLHCGSPFPWTKSALESAALIIQEDEQLNELISSQLINSLPDLITETPRTQLAVTRTKKALVSAGKFTVEAIRQFAIDFGCELVKTQLGLK